MPNLPFNNHNDNDTNNEKALVLANDIYTATQACCDTNPYGENRSESTLRQLNNSKFLFPKNCKFCCKNVSEIDRYLADQLYDLVLLDPPWWNKYVRRKRAKTDHGYEMMYNHNLLGIPIERFLKDDGLVAVWCTNSRQHQHALVNEIFEKWNVSYVGKWHWLKV